jgi:hypothetical protein
MKGIFDYSWTKCWMSENAPNSWLQIHFGLRRVIVTHYSIKTYPCGRGCSHMKSWVLEGAIAGSTIWFEMDKRVDNEELNGKSKVATFECSSLHEVQVLRIKQIAENHHGDHYLIITNLEIFGELGN